MTLRPGRRTLIAAAIAMALLAMGYHALARYADTLRPNIAHNYVAAIHDQSRAIGPQQRAWPRYRAAVMLRGGLRSIGEASLPVRPWDPTWNDTRAFLEQPATVAMLELVRQAAQLPHLACEYRDARSPEDAALEGKLPGIASDRPDMQLLLLLAPSTLSNVAGVVGNDCLLAADRGDFDRAIADVAALAGIIRQLTQQPFVVEQLHATHHVHHLAALLCDLRQLGFEACSAAQLDQLQHAVQQIDPGWFAVRIEHERTSFLDHLQRMYTDEGGGRGRFLLQESRNHGREHPQQQWCVTKVLEYHFSPVADRATMLAEYERLFALAQGDLQRPSWDPAPWPSVDELARLRDDVRLGLVALHGPHLQGVWFRGHLAAMQRDAVVAGLALERYRRRMGTYPPRLSDLVPQWLPALPVDVFTGRPLGYLAEGPYLYSVSYDRHDDQLTLEYPDANFKVRDLPRPSDASAPGDWLLWGSVRPPAPPPPESQPVLIYEE